jgi:hypothetical protein
MNFLNGIENIGLIIIFRLIWSDMYQYQNSKD